MCAKVAALTNENREEGMEDYYKYQYLISGYDYSELPVRKNQLTPENCIHCGHQKCFANWPDLS